MVPGLALVRGLLDQGTAQVIQTGRSPGAASAYRGHVIRMRTRPGQRLAMDSFDRPLAKGVVPSFGYLGAGALDCMGAWLCLALLGSAWQADYVRYRPDHHPV